MTAALPRKTYAIDDEGKTRGITEFGEFELTGEVSAWVRLISKWVAEGLDLDEAIANLEPRRAAHVRKMWTTMETIGAFEWLPEPGEVLLVGEEEELERALALSSGTVPSVILGAGPLRGDWLAQMERKPAVAMLGLVLHVDGQSLVLGPAPVDDVLAAVETLRAGDLPDGRPSNSTVRRACAQLVRRAAHGDRLPHVRSAWNGVSVGRNETTLWRLLPHPWQKPDLTRAHGSFDERVMAAIDALHGVIRAVEETDLPQVPRHMAKASVHGRATLSPLSCDVVGDGSDFEQARRKAVLLALTLQAEATADPRRVYEATGVAASSPDTTDLVTLRNMAIHIAENPDKYVVRALRLMDGAETTIPVRRAFRCDDATQPSPGTAAEESRERALINALLDVLERWTESGAQEVVSVDDFTGLPSETVEEYERLRSLDQEAWLGMVEDTDVPTAVAGTRRGAATACGTDAGEALARAAARAVRAEQVLLAERPGLVPDSWGPALRVPGRSAPANLHPPLTVEELTLCVVARDPDAVVIDLDHDPTPARLGLHVLKVVSDQ